MAMARCTFLSTAARWAVRETPTPAACVAMLPFATRAACYAEVHTSSPIRVISSAASSLAPARGRPARRKSTIASGFRALTGSKPSKAVLAGRKAYRRGKALEERVAAILRAEGRSTVRTNVMLKDAEGNLSEIDVVAGRIFKTYIECKNYTARVVPLEDVAKFKAVLQLNGIPLSRGLVVAPGGFSKRASTIGITCVDGEALQRWEDRARGAVLRRRIASFIFFLCAVGVGVVAQAPLLLELAGIEGDDAASATLLHLHGHYQKYWSQVSKLLTRS